MKVPFETFEVNDSKEVWGHFIVSVKPSPNECSEEYPQRRKVEAEQHLFIESAIRAALDRERDS